MEDEELTLRSRIHRIDKYIVLGNDLQLIAKDSSHVRAVQSSVESLKEIRQSCEGMIYVILNYKNKFVSLNSKHNLEFSEAKAAEGLRERLGLDEKLIGAILKRPEFIDYCIIDVFRNRYASGIKI